MFGSDPARMQSAGFDVPAHQIVNLAIAFASIVEPIGGEFCVAIVLAQRLFAQDARQVSRPGIDLKSTILVP